MSKLYAIRQTKFEKYWYDFVEDFTSAELNKDCISNNLTYVKECQNNLETLNPAWKNSEIVEFRELGDLIDFENLYYKSLEQRAFLEKQLAEKDAELEEVKRHRTQILNFGKRTKKVVIANPYGKDCVVYNQEDQDKISFCIEQLEKVKEHILSGLAFDIDVQMWFEEYIDNQIEELKKEMK